MPRKERLSAFLATLQEMGLDLNKRVYALSSNSDGKGGLFSVLDGQE